MAQLNPSVRPGQVSLRAPQTGRPRTAPSPPNRSTRGYLTGEAPNESLLGGETAPRFVWRASNDLLNDNSLRRHRDKFSKGGPFQHHDSFDVSKSWRFAETMPFESVRTSRASSSSMDAEQPSDFELPNLSRALRAEWASLAREREQLKTERRTLAVSRNLADPYIVDLEHEVSAS